MNDQNQPQRLEEGEGAKGRGVPHYGVSPKRDDKGKPQPLGGNDKPTVEPKKEGGDK